MKRKILWILPILVGAAAITIFVIALLRDGGDPNKTNPVVQTEAPVQETLAPAAVSTPAVLEAEEPEPTEEPVEMVSAYGQAVTETPTPVQQGGNWGSQPSNTQPPPMQGQDEDELPLMP